MSLEIKADALRDVAGIANNASGAVKMTASESVVRASLIAERDLKDVALAGAKAERRGLFLEGRAQFALGIRSGHAVNSVSGNVFKRGDTWISSTGSPLAYVLMNENGGQITAKGRALAIPTVNALTPSGALNNRFSGLGSLRQARDPGGRKLFVWKGKRKGTDGAWLAGTSGDGAGTVVRDTKTGRFKRGGRLVLYFLLRRSVQIPARYMFRNSKRRIEPIIAEETNASMKLAMQKAWSKR